MKIDSTSAHRVLASRALKVEGWANRRGRLTITARLGHVKLGTVSRRIGKSGHGARVATHRLTIHLRGAGLRALRAHPHRTITATAVTRDTRGHTAHISAHARLGK